MAMNGECLVEELRGEFDQLVDSSCVDCVAGPPTGSVIHLKFRQATGVVSDDFSLLVECAWRLDSREGVLCSWTDAGASGGAWLEQICLVVGQRVKSVKLSSPGLDVCITFESGLCLRIFCDQTDISDEGDNYLLGSTARTFTVHPKGRLSVSAGTVTETGT